MKESSARRGNSGRTTQRRNGVHVTGGNGERVLI